MSAVSQAKKLKITVTNIRSILSKKTKRLANLKKINSRDQNKLFSQQKRQSAERKIESRLKGISKKITSPLKKASSKLKIGTSAKLILAGVAINAVFGNLVQIQESAENLKKKIEKWWEKSRPIRKTVKQALDLIDGSKLKEMSEKFSNQTKKLDEEFEKMKNPNSVYTIPDPDNPKKTMKISAKKFWNDEIEKIENKTGQKIPKMEDKDFINMKPIKEDTNLSSLLNSNGSNGKQVVLLKQPIIYEA